MYNLQYNRKIGVQVTVGTEQRTTAIAYYHLFSLQHLQNVRLKLVYVVIFSGSYPGSPQDDPIDCMARHA